MTLRTAISTVQVSQLHKLTGTESAEEAMLCCWSLRENKMEAQLSFPDRGTHAETHPSILFQPASIACMTKATLNWLKVGQDLNQKEGTEGQ